MEAKQFKPSRISIDVNITDKTNPEQLADNVEFFLNELKQRGIVASASGITASFKQSKENPGTQASRQFDEE